MSTALWTDSRFSGPELLQISDAVAREKGLSKEKVLEAMEEAIQRAAKSRYGSENDIRVKIDQKTGEVGIFQCLTVVEEIEEPKEIEETAVFDDADETDGAVRLEMPDSDDDVKDDNTLAVLVDNIINDDGEGK